MAKKKFWLGSVGPFVYDDTKTYADAVDQIGFRTEGSIRCEGAPVNPEDVMRKGDTPTLGGSSTNFTVVSTIQVGGLGGVGFQYKTRDLTLNDGVITTVSAESGWNDI